MFENACTFYTRSLCQVGGEHVVVAAMRGMGCLLSATHILTAHHNHLKLVEEYGHSSVLKYDGIFRCELEEAYPNHDVCLLRATDLIEAHELWPAPPKYPEILAARPNLGSKVGFLSYLHRTDPDGGGPHMYTHFAGAHLAFRLVERPHPVYWWALSASLCDPGFSGSPSFLQNNGLVGLIVQAREVISAPSGFESIPLHLPVMADITGLKAAIKAHLVG